MQFWIFLIIIAFIVFIAWNFIYEYRKTKKIRLTENILEWIILIVLVLMLTKTIVFKY